MPSKLCGRRSQKCIFYSNEPHCTLHNIAQCKEELLGKGYPKTWWEALFQHALMKYGPPPELTQAAMQVLNSAHVPWHAQLGLATLKGT